jgi:hypothetical protein
LEFSFDFHFAGPFVLLSIVAAAGISYLLYFRNAENSGLTKFQKSILVLLRFLALLLIFLFLLSPFIARNKRIKQLPILAVAFDNSSSVKAYTDSINRFNETLKNQFKDDYQLDFWSFGEKTERAELVSATEKSSDYGQLLKTMKGYYLNKNMGALILIGDGIYNQGQNPANIAPELKFPVYSIGVGDTTRRTDALIRNVRTNKTAYLKNKFPVEFELKFSKLKNRMAYIEIENNHRQVYNTTISIGSDDDFKLEIANLEATQRGFQHYKIRIRPFAGEENIKNNAYEFVIQILENKQKILLLSEGPHPDLGAIRSSLLELQSYEIKMVTGNEVPDSIESYSLVVLNQLPSVRNAANRLLTTIKDSRVPVLFLVGPGSLTEQLNSLDMGLRILTSQSVEEVQPIFDPNFSLFVLPDEVKQIFEEAPPLVSPFGNTDLVPSLQNLAIQSIRNIPTTKTLMAFGTYKGRKVGYIIGEGIWRWRLYNFETSENHDAFNELIQKTVQYLALRENEDNFNVYCPALFQETDDIELTAELYNDSYELVNTPEVSISIKNDSLTEFTYVFDRTDDAYRLNAGNLEPGDYTFVAQTKLGNQNFTEKGSFSILRNELENINNQSDFDVLYQLSEKSGGKFYSYENYGTLLDMIRIDKQITVQIHKQTQKDEWINLKFLFFILIIVMGTEWFLRKYCGIY